MLNVYSNRNKYSLLISSLEIFFFFQIHKENKRTKENALVVSLLFSMPISIRRIFVFYFVFLLFLIRYISINYQTIVIENKTNDLKVPRSSDRIICASRSQSIFYCSVPKVATRTILIYLTYLHIRDELLPSIGNNDSKLDIFNLPYIKQMISSSFKVNNLILLFF